MQAQSYRNLFDRNWDELKENIRFAASYKEKWTLLVPLFEQISAQNAVFIMIWNVITNRVIYTVDKKNVVGYATEYLAENWFEISFANIHPEFVHVVTLIMAKGTQYVTEKGNSEQEKFIINFDFVFKRATGEYFHLLQQTLCIEKDTEGNPFLFLSYVHDITYIKKSKTADLVITSTNEMNWWNFNFNKNCLEPVQPLSKQEKKILAYLAEGKSSKGIAKELFISPLTVDKHRRNLLSKTNCIDTTGMITYCKLVGLL